MEPENEWVKHSSAVLYISVDILKNVDFDEVDRLLVINFNPDVWSLMVSKPVDGRWVYRIFGAGFTDEENGSLPCYEAYLSDGEIKIKKK